MVDQSTDGIADSSGKRVGAERVLRKRVITSLFSVVIVGGLGGLLAFVVLTTIGGPTPQAQGATNSSSIQTSSSPSPSTAPLIASWSGSIPITSTGDYSWASNTVTVTTMPDSLNFAYRIDGGTADLSNVRIQPVLMAPTPTPSGPGAPTNAPTEIQVTFTVVSYSGSPSFNLVQAEARGVG
jgi:hypothetical protein